jgi:hypothetical protein
VKIVSSRADFAQLTLALLVSGFRTNDAHHALANNDLAVAADLFY